MIVLIALIALFTDLYRRKIYNWITFPAMISGLLLMSYHYGWTGFIQSLSGACLGLLCFGFFMAFRWMGAGDVKLLMAFGAWGGARYSFSVAFLSVILGGLFAFVILVVNGKFLDFLKRFYRFALSFLVRELEPEAFRADRRLRLPFAVPLTLAAVLEAFGLNFYGVWNG